MFTEFKPSNTNHMASNQIFISIDWQGQFNFSQRALRLSGIEIGSKIKILQDQTRKKDWFIAYDDEGYEVSKCSNTVGFACSELARLIKESINQYGKFTIRIPVAPQWEVKYGVKVLPLITSAAFKFTRSEHKSLRDVQRV